MICTQAQITVLSVLLGTYDLSLRRRGARATNTGEICGLHVCRFSKRVESTIEAFRIRPVVLLPRDDDFRVIDRLKTVPEHRTVFLIHDGRSDHNSVVRSNTEILAVKGRMVNLAKRQTIADDRLATLLGVRDNMCGIEQTRVSEPAYRASFPVCPQNPVPE